jgi:hypothetical protein
MLGWQNQDIFNKLNLRIIGGNIDVSTTRRAGGRLNQTAGRRLLLSIWEFFTKLEAIAFVCFDMPTASLAAQ